MIYILVSIFPVISLLIGYYIGSKRSLKQDVRQIRKDIERTLEKDDIGPVHRPSAETLYDLSHPHIAEEKQAMKETLDKQLV